MRTILILLLKDLRRDWKRPWSILIFAALPLLLSTLMAFIFGGSGGKTAAPTIHIALLDQDQDLLARAIRSMSSQGDAARQLQLHLVENEAEGLRMLEERRASAFVILPLHLTEDLLNGKTNTIGLYENPAEQVLPKVVRQGVTLLAAGLSGAADLLHEPLSEIRQLFKGSGFPAEGAVTAMASSSVEKLRGVRVYLFPPLIQFKTVKASDYRVSSTNAPEQAPKP